MSVATTEDIAALKVQIARLTALLAGGAAPALAPPRNYSVNEVAAMLGRRPFTVREWCRLGQVNAFKLPGFRSGDHERWLISSAEVERYRAEGLLAANARRNEGRRAP
jgi:hypothetical protein